MAGQVKFSPGPIRATIGIAQLFGEELEKECGNLLDRHLYGDWGNVSADDRQLNEEAVELQDGSRIMSIYDEEETIWIITDAVGTKHANTIVTLPEEY